MRRRTTQGIQLPRGKVLIVDDEDALVLGLLRLLYQDNDRYDVLLAKNGRIATQVLGQSQIDVMVLNIGLKATPEVDLLQWVSNHSPRTALIGIGSATSASERQRATRLGCLHVLQKPFDLHRVRKVVVEALRTEGNFGGNLADISLVDVIQMLCQSRKTAAIRVTEGKQIGTLCIKEGRLCHAVWGHLIGEEAFHRVMAATVGAFKTVPLPEGVPTTIESNLQDLLFDTMSLRDESAQGETPSAPLPSVAGRVEPPSAAGGLRSKISALIETPIPGEKSR